MSEALGIMTWPFVACLAVCASLFATSLCAQRAIGWTVATLSGVAGSYSSYRLDLPTGAAVVCALGLTLVLTGIGRAMGLMIKR